MASRGWKRVIVTIAAVAAVWLLGLGAASAQQEAGEGASGTRTFDGSTVAPGGPLVVTIAVTGYGQVGGVTEMLPEGFTYVSSSHPAGQVLVDGAVLRFTLVGAASAEFDYTVTAPVVEGSYRFEGTLRDDDRVDHAIGGASEVTVAASTPGPTAEPTPAPTADLTPTPAVGPTVSPAAPTTPGPTIVPTPSPMTPASPTPTSPPAPTPTSAAPTPEPPATPARTPTGAPTATTVPTMAAAPSPTPATAGPRSTPTPIPAVPVVAPASGDGLPAWVIPVVVVVSLLVLVGGIGICATSRRR